MRLVRTQGLSMSAPEHCEETLHVLRREKVCRLVEPLPDGGLRLDRQTGKFGPMPKGDPALPPHPLRDLAHVRVIQMLHVIAAVEYDRGSYGRA